MRKGFTLLELLVVIAIIAIISVIAIPNFIGKIDQAKDSRELAEINAVGKAISTYYVDNGIYPTLQGKDGTLLQPQPIEGAPHNIDFSSLVPAYLDSLPHFSYWWVDYQGEIYHTEKPLGVVQGNVFTPTQGYTYTNESGTQIVGDYTINTNEYLVVKDEKGRNLPKLGLFYKNEKMHPESPDYIANHKPEASITVTPNLTSATNITWSYAGSTDLDGDSIVEAEWSLDGVVQSSMPTTLLGGTYAVGLKVKDSSNNWSDVVTRTVVVDKLYYYTVYSYVDSYALGSWSALTTVPFSTLNSYGVSSYGTTYTGGNWLSLSLVNKNFNSSYSINSVSGASASGTTYASIGYAPYGTISMGYFVYPTQIVRWELDKVLGLRNSINTLNIVKSKGSTQYGEVSVATQLYPANGYTVITSPIYTGNAWTVYDSYK